MPSSSHSDLCCRFPEVEKNDWDVDDAEDDTVEIGVALISHISRSVCWGADRSILALILHSSQRSEFSFRIYSISKDVGSICFLASLIICFDIELVCSQIQETGVTCAVERYFDTLDLFFCCSSASIRTLWTKDNSSAGSSLSTSSMRKTSTASFSAALNLATWCD